jgi:hypothetical protein
MENSSGWWFVVYRSTPREMHALITRDPRKIQTPTGRRLYPDEDLIYYAELTIDEYELGITRLIHCFKNGPKPGPDLRMAIEFQQVPNV